MRFNLGNVDYKKIALISFLAILISLVIKFHYVFLYVLMFVADICSIILPLTIVLAIFLSLVFLMKRKNINLGFLQILYILIVVGVIDFYTTDIAVLFYLNKVAFFEKLFVLFVVGLAVKALILDKKFFPLIPTISLIAFIISMYFLLLRGLV